jgi:hypothetical protein
MGHSRNKEHADLPTHLSPDEVRGRSEKPRAKLKTQPSRKIDDKAARRAVAANRTFRWSYFAYAISWRTSSSICASLISDRHTLQFKILQRDLTPVLRRPVEPAGVDRKWRRRCGQSNMKMPVLWHELTVAKDV